MTHIPKLPQTDNPYELAMHAANVRYYEQHKFNPRIEAIQDAGTVICVQFLVGLVVLMAAGFVVMDYSQPSQPVLSSALEHLSK